jgi:hypothetical protein
MALWPAPAQKAVRRRSIADAHARRCDGFEELAAIANPGDANVLETLHGQLGKYLGVDTVVAKRRFVIAPAPATPQRPYRPPCIEPFSRS